MNAVETEFKANLSRDIRAASTEYGTAWFGTAFLAGLSLLVWALTWRHPNAGDWVVWAVMPVYVGLCVRSAYQWKREHKRLQLKFLRLYGYQYHHQWLQDIAITPELRGRLRQHEMRRKRSKKSSPLAWLTSKL